MTCHRSSNVISLILALICVAVVVWVRSLPASLPGAEELAEKVVARDIRLRVATEAVQNVPAEQWEQTIDAAARRWTERNPAELAAKRAKALANIKAEMTFVGDDGRSYTYLGDYDSYVWLRNARTYLQNGTTCDAIVGGECRDTFGNAPVGYRMIYNHSLHIAAIVAVHRVINAFRPGYPLAASAFLIPVILGALGVLPAFFVARRLGGNVAAIVAALAISLDVNFLLRSAGSDNDVWNVVMPLYVAWPLLAALSARNIARAAACAVLAGLVTGLYAAVWRGWIFSFLIMLCAALGCLALGLLRQSARDGWRLGWRAPEIRALAAAVLGYYLASGFFTAFTDFSGFSALFIPTGSGGRAAAAAVQLWPFAFAAVSELGRLLPTDIAESMGGVFVFFAGWLGMLSLVVPFERPRPRHIVISLWILAVLLGWYYFLAASDLPIIFFTLLFGAPFAAELSIRAWKNEPVGADEAAAVLVLVWFFAALYQVFSGIRFLMLFAIPFGFALGAFAGRVGAVLDRLFAQALPRRTALARAASCLIALCIVAYPVRRGYAAMKNYYPAMNDAWWDTLLEIKSRSAPEAIVNTWWDYGYWVKYVAERRVSSDGGMLATHVPHWLARALVAPSDVQSRGILRMLNCGSDATALPEARYGAFGKLIAMGVTEYRAYEILNALIELDRRAAARYLAAGGFSPEQQETVLASTHCRPPESFLVISREMIAKGEGWMWLGSWDIRRAYLARRTRLFPEPDAVEDLQRLGYTAANAKAAYDVVARLNDRGQIDNFIAPLQQLIPREWIPCREVGREMACLITITNDAGVSRVEFRYDPAAPKNGSLREGERKGNAAALLVAGEQSLDERLDASPAFSEFGVLLDVAHRRILVGSPLLIRSTLVRLFYLDGRYSHIFKPFARKTTHTDEEVATFKIGWDD